MCFHPIKKRQRTRPHCLGFGSGSGFNGAVPRYNAKRTQKGVYGSDCDRPAELTGPNSQPLTLDLLFAQAAQADELLPSRLTAQPSMTDFRLLSRNGGASAQVVAG